MEIVKSLAQSANPSWGGWSAIGRVAFFMVGCGDRPHSLPAVQTIHTGQGNLAHGARGRLRANAPEQTATNFGFGDDGPRLVKVAEVALLVAEVPPLQAEVARTAEIAGLVALATLHRAIKAKASRLFMVQSPKNGGKTGLLSRRTLIEAIFGQHGRHHPHAGSHTCRHNRCGAESPRYCRCNSRCQASL